MNNQEAALVLAKAQAYRPGIVVDDITVAAWQEAFDDIRFEDASRAVTNLGRASSQYLDPAKIRDEVTRILAEHRSGEQTCQICNGTWEQCSRRHALEVSKGVPDPHEFETAEMAKRNASTKQYGEEARR